jgi:hypothetical protein
VEVLRNDRLVVQSSHKGLIKSTGVTGRGEGLLCQGLSLNEAQALFNADILSGHQFNVGKNLSNYHLKAGDLSESHVHKLSDSHAFLASSSSDNDLSLSDSQALLPFELSGVLSFKCDDLSLVSSDDLSGFSKGDDLSSLFKCDDLSLSFKFDDHITLPFVLSGSASLTVSGDLLEVSLVSSDLLGAFVEPGDLSVSDSYHASGLEPCIFSPSQVVRDLVESDEVSDLSALMSNDLEDTSTRTDNIELLCAELDLSMPYLLECLKHPDLWIGDMGASMHTTRYKTHGFNFRAGSSSVGATGSAVEAECSMDICGQFVNRDSSLGIVATLTDVGFSTRHNFNLLSVTSLWQQGWSTQSGDSEGLSIIGPDGGSVINFDTVLRITRGAVCCICWCFVRLARQR